MEGCGCGSGGCCDAGTSDAGELYGEQAGEVPQEAALASLHPVGRMGEIRDIVDAVLYLEKAGFVTGEILHVDGGQNAGR